MDCGTGIFQFEYLGVEEVKNNKTGEVYRFQKFLDRNSKSSTRINLPEDMSSKIASIKEGEQVNLKIRVDKNSNNGKYYFNVEQIQKAGSTG